MNKNRHALKPIIIILLLVVMAACGPSGDDEPIPTLMQMPESTAESDTTPGGLTAGRPTLPATWTPTVTPSPTITPSVTITATVTPSSTITDTPAPTLTPSPIPPTQERPVTNLAILAQEATILPDDYVVPPFNGPDVTLPPITTPLNTTAVPGLASTSEIRINCPYFPSGGFATIFTNNLALAQQLGCPVGAPPTTSSVQAAVQNFETGVMVWLNQSPPAIYVLYNTGVYAAYPDVYNPDTDPESGGETPPAGLLEPVRGFGKIWRGFNTVRDGLGWAQSEETGTQATIQQFEQGWMIWLPVRPDVLVLVTTPQTSSGAWQSVPGGF